MVPDYIATKVQKGLRILENPSTIYSWSLEGSDTHVEWRLSCTMSRNYSPGRAGQRCSTLAIKDRIETTSVRGNILKQMKQVWNCRAL